MGVEVARVDDSGREQRFLVGKDEVRKPVQEVIDDTRLANCVSLKRVGDEAIVGTDHVETIQQALWRIKVARRESGALSALVGGTDGVEVLLAQGRWMTQEIHAEHQAVPCARVLRNNSAPDLGERRQDLDRINGKRQQYDDLPLSEAVAL